MNLNKINKIFNNKYLFKKYLAYWMSKFYTEGLKDENSDNKSKYIEFVNELINSIFKNKENYLEIILNKLDAEISNKRILVILNNMDSQNLKWIEKKKYLNLNFLFIFNIQDNFDIFQNYYYDEEKLKKFFVENQEEIFYKDPIKKNEDEIYYQMFQTKEEYEQSRKELINKVFKD